MYVPNPKMDERLIVSMKRLLDNYEGTDVVYNRPLIKNR